MRRDGTDLTAWGLKNSAHSLTEEMTRSIALGFSLEEIVTMATTNPAKALGQDQRLGCLAVGRQANISVLDIKGADWIVHDNQGIRSGGPGSLTPPEAAKEGGSLRTDRPKAPVLAIKRGEALMADWGPRPWGWESDRFERRRERMSR